MARKRACASAELMEAQLLIADADRLDRDNDDATSPSLEKSPARPISTTVRRTWRPSSKRARTTTTATSQSAVPPTRFPMSRERSGPRNWRTDSAALVARRATCDHTPSGRMRLSPTIEIMSATRGRRWGTWGPGARARQVEDVSLLRPTTSADSAPSSPPPRSPHPRSAPPGTPTPAPARPAPRTPPQQWTEPGSPTCCSPGC